jgi:hypothetical protein
MSCSRHGGTRNIYKNVIYNSQEEITGKRVCIDGDTTVIYFKEMGCRTLNPVAFHEIFDALMKFHVQ